MSVFDTSVTASATLPTWFSDAQKAIGTSGKTVYDAATPFSGTATATMSKDLFGTPSTQSMPNYYAPQGASATATPHTEEDWNNFSTMAKFAPGTDMAKAKADYMSGVGGGGVSVAGGATGGGALPTQSNPFRTAMDTLQGVASGAANPFLSTGAPNTQTALGGLFAAQNAKLDQILPGLTSQVGAGGIGGGNFGSLRGQTAVNTARAGALTTLAEQQNKAALDAQGYAINAAKGVGDVGSQYSTSAINTGKEEMGADLNQLAKYSDLINAMGPTMDKTTTTTTKGSTYENLLKALQAAGAAGVSIDKILGGNSGLSWLDDIMKSGGGNNSDSIYGGDTSKPGHWEGGEWIED